LRYALLGVVCIILNMHVVEASKNKLSHMKVCFNNVPPTFGRTHFIVGHEERIVPQKEKKLHVAHKKQQVSVSGLDKKRTTQSFFTTIHDLSPILLEIMADAKKCLYIAAFNLT